MALQEGRISRSQSLLEPLFYESKGISSEEIVRRVSAHADRRPNWVIGSGGEATAGVISRMYGRGYSGPLWEYLIR